MRKTLSLLIIFLLLLSACGKAPATVITTPVPTPTPSPTPETITYKNPLTGLKTEKDISMNRPFAVMVNDIKAALPQCGVGSADIIYEVAAEGGITRMLAVYQDISKAGTIGSVRSTRTYYLDIAEGLDAILLHAGASTYAYDALSKRPIDHIDGIFNSSIFFRDENRMSKGYEHSLFTNSDLVLRKAGDYIDRLTHKDGYQYVMKFGGSSAAVGSSANTLSVEFSGYKTGLFTYNQSDGLYHIEQFGEAYTDGNTGKQVAVKNVLVLYAEHSAITNDELSRIDVNLVGKGKGIYACNGKYIEIEWSKVSSSSQFVYRLKDGSALSFAPGTTYVNIIATDRRVELT